MTVEQQRKRINSFDSQSLMCSEGSRPIFHRRVLDWGFWQHFIALSLTCASIPATIALAGGTLHVSPLGSNTPPFANWGDASTTIQGAIDWASDGDTILVDSGSYIGSGNRDIGFQGKQVCLIAPYGYAATTINCEADYLNAHRGFRFTEGEGSGTVVEGFTVRGGYAPLDGPAGLSYGGGMLFDSASSPTVRECMLEFCVAEDAGGAVACLNASSPHFQRVRFFKNRVYKVQILSHAGFGGAIRCEQSSPAIDECVFDSNVAHAGGAISCNNSSPVIESTLFSGNIAALLGFIDNFEEGVGGALHLFQSQMTLEGSSLIANKAHVATVERRGGRGGAIAMFSSSAQLRFSTFHRNAALGSDTLAIGLGGGCYLSNSTIDVTNCIISGSEDGGSVFCADALDSSEISCTDVIANVGGDWEACIGSFAGMNGNFSLNPDFCDSLSNRLTVSTVSPCTPAYSPCGQQVGAMPSECVRTWISHDSSLEHPITSELALFPNPFNATLYIQVAQRARGPVSVRVYNTLGRLVHQLSEEAPPGNTYGVRWTPEHDSRSSSPSGVYFIRVTTREGELTRSVTMLK